jgi:hypothetical protein
MYSSCIQLQSSRWIAQCIIVCCAKIVVGTDETKEIAFLDLESTIHCNTHLKKCKNTHWLKNWKSTVLMPWKNYLNPCHACLHTSLKRAGRPSFPPKWPPSLKGTALCLFFIFYLFFFLENDLLSRFIYLLKCTKITPNALNNAQSRVYLSLPS